MLVTLWGQRVNQSCCADIVSSFVILSFFFQFPYIPYALRGVHMIITIKGCILLQFFFGIFSNHSQLSFPTSRQKSLANSVRPTGEFRCCVLYIQMRRHEDD